MRHLILIFLMLLCQVPTTTAAGTSPANEPVHLIAIEHDQLTDPQTGARLPGPEVWVPQYDEKLLSGGTLYVSVPECGIDGHARVLSIGECPQVSPRPGPEFQLVTATFRHHHARVIDVHVAGLAEPIGTTPNHPFWSEDRHDFVRADELKVGEQLRQADGSLARVTGLVPRAGEHDVYNLEVQVDHTYHVSASGVLVHNGTPDCDNIVYRLLRADEIPGVGLFAKNKDALFSLNQHVRNGSRLKTQFVSTSRNLEYLRKWQQPGQRIVAIDLRKLQGAAVFDLSTSAGRSAHLSQKIPRDFAKGASEVVIQGFIPPTAIRSIP